MREAAPGSRQRPYPQRAYLLEARDAAAAAITLTEQERAGLQGRAIGEKIREKRLAAVSAVKDSM